MRVNFNCEKCAELVSFEVEGVSPRDMLPISDIVKEEVGPVDQKLLMEVIDEELAGKGYKKIRFFKNCPKCGSEIVYVYYGLQS